MSRREIFGFFCFYKPKMKNEDKYMKLALKLARQGKGRVSPNPLVGAVLVKEGKIVGQGYHTCFGDKHAEIEALEKAGRNARGATLYINLEPCVHFGKTPPCIPEIIKAGIKKVVIGILDPNPLNHQKGVKALKKAGIEVIAGEEEKKCCGLNREFITQFKKG